MSDTTPAVSNAIELMNLPEGKVTLSMPANLSAESMQEFEVWLQLILRRMSRTIGDGKVRSAPQAPVVDLPKQIAAVPKTAPAKPDETQKQSGQSAPVLDPNVYPTAPGGGSS